MQQCINRKAQKLCKIHSFNSEIKFFRHYPPEPLCLSCRPTCAPGDTSVPGLGVPSNSIIPLITNLQASLKAPVPVPVPALASAPRSPPPSSFQPPRAAPAPTQQQKYEETASARSQPQPPPASSATKSSSVTEPNSIQVKTTETAILYFNKNLYCLF